MQRHPQYWQIKAIELEGQMLQQEIRARVSAFEAKRKAAHEAAGLTYGQAYSLDDATETITAVDGGTDAAAA